MSRSSTAGADARTFHRVDIGRNGVIHDLAVELVAQHNYVLKGLLTAVPSGIPVIPDLRFSEEVEPRTVDDTCRPRVESVPKKMVAPKMRSNAPKEFRDQYARARAAG